MASGDIKSDNSDFFSDCFFFLFLFFFVIYFSGAVFLQCIAGGGGARVMASGDIKSDNSDLFFSNFFYRNIYFLCRFSLVLQEEEEEHASWRVVTLSLTMRAEPMRDTEGCHDDDDGDAGDDDDDSSNNDDNHIDDSFHVNDENNAADDKNRNDDENFPFIEKQGGMKKEPTSTCALLTKTHGMFMIDKESKDKDDDYETVCLFMLCLMMQVFPL